ncbi:hypothetical protein CEXT_750951 [Caerostris extrusa]|uniref:PH domain-containing protein n=1 Tax=Caerostris extrusa TaxID=172846 RepID=A0AAV4P093_CAEEX|nr:hypothetical protein CEXT_750951 [Caerostris extrusa]
MADDAYKVIMETNNCPTGRGKGHNLFVTKRNSSGFWVCAQNLNHWEERSILKSGGSRAAVSHAREGNVSKKRDTSASSTPANDDSFSPALFWGVLKNKRGSLRRLWANYWDEPVLAETECFKLSEKVCVSSHLLYLNSGTSTINRLASKNTFFAFETGSALLFQKEALSLPTLSCL